MKIRTLLLAFVAVISLVSCKNSAEENKETPESRKTDITEQKEPVDQAHNSENSLDWAATYEGVVPCADCPGIKMKVVLNKDQTYELEMDYLERDTKVNENGKFEWTDGGSKIKLEPENNKEDHKKMFMVGENQLFQLDADGKQPTGEMAEEYTLKKSDVER